MTTWQKALVLLNSVCLAQGSVPRKQMPEVFVDQLSDELVIQDQSAHLKVSQVHAGPLTHVQEIFDVTLVHDDVHSHLPLEAGV